MEIKRMMTNLCSDQLAESKHFYQTLFDFEIDFESDWFVHLISKDKKLELGIISRSSEIVPQEFQNTPQGFYLTFVVEDVDQLFELAMEKDLQVVAEPTDTFYGQRRLLLKDPDGTLVDISSPISN